MKYFSKVFRESQTLINVPSLINLDFADVQTVMTDKGIAHIGIGYGKGDEKALDAVKEAVASPLLETTIAGAFSMSSSIFPEIFLLWMQVMQQNMFRILQAKRQISSLVRCMMILRQTKQLLQLLLTGLHTTGGAAAKLKSRLEGQRQASVFGGQQAPHQGTQRGLDYSMAPGQYATPHYTPGQYSQRTSDQAPSFNQPKAPQGSRVKEQSIKIPDFFKR